MSADHTIHLTWARPTPTRAAATARGLEALPGVSRTASDHRAKDQLSTRSPPHRCAAQPPGTCTYAAASGCRSAQPASIGVRVFNQQHPSSSGSQPANPPTSMHSTRSSSNQPGKTGTEPHLRDGIAPVEGRQHHALDSLIHSNLQAPIWEREGSTQGEEASSRPMERCPPGSPAASAPIPRLQPARPPTFEHMAVHAMLKPTRST